MFNPAQAFQTSQERQALLERVAAAQKAHRRVAALRDELEREKSALAAARARIEERKAEVLERAPGLLGAATTLTGARKRLDVSTKSRLRLKDQQMQIESDEQTEIESKGSI